MQGGIFMSKNTVEMLLDFTEKSTHSHVDYNLLCIDDSGNLKITNLDRLFFTKNGEFTI